MRNLIFFPITTTIFKVSYILFSHFLPNFSGLLLGWLGQSLGTGLPCGPRHTTLLWALVFLMGKQVLWGQRQAK